ncbi:MAG: hypothetical protein HZA90_25915 [Verrucomicrobia bacterium]|nr:hypothetical protein [Verrucomicrobiota bacterium]
MLLKKLTQPVTKQSALRLALLAAAIVPVVWGGHFAWQRISRRSPTTASVRQQIWSHLKERSRQDNFKLAQDWTSLTNFTAAQPDDSNAAGFAEGPAKVKPFKVDKALKLKAKPKNLPPLHVGFSTFFRAKQKEATSYESIYFLIGQELWAAEQMFALTDPAVQQVGIVLASEAAHYAQSDAEDGWLAARICEGYLWPGVDLLEKVDQPLTTPDQLLALCDTAFRANDETVSLERNYEFMIRKIPKRAELARFRLAALYEQEGQFAKALKTLQEMEDPQRDKVKARIEALKARLQSEATK